MIKNSSFTGGSFQWQCGRNLHHGILMLLHMYPYYIGFLQILTKKCLQGDFLYKHWNQKKSPPQNKKSSNISYNLNSDATFFGFFSSPKFWGQNSWRETGPQKERFGDPNWTSLGVFGATFGARTPASGM